MRRLAAIALAFVALIVATALAQPAEPDCTTQDCTYLALVARPGVGATATGTRVPTATPTKTSTATPTRTATPTATQVPVALLANGDFEQDGLHWFDTGNFITDTLPIAAHSGAFAAWLRGDLNTEISRDITVPADKPYLSYWIWIRSTEPTCGDDRGGVGMSGMVPPLVDSVDLCVATATSGWINRVVDLSAMAGQAGTLSFLTGTFDGDLTGSELLIDDVGFRSVP